MHHIQPQITLRRLIQIMRDDARLVFGLCLFDLLHRQSDKNRIRLGVAFKGRERLQAKGREIAQLANLRQLRRPGRAKAHRPQPGAGLHQRLLGVIGRHYGQHIAWQGLDHERQGLTG